MIFFYENIQKHLETLCQFIKMWDNKLIPKPCISKSSISADTRALSFRISLLCEALFSQTVLTRGFPLQHAPEKKQHLKHAFTS